MSDNIGVSVEEFIDAVIESYQKGFNDALDCLKVAQTTINPKEMKISIRELLQKQGKIEIEW